MDKQPTRKDLEAKERVTAKSPLSPFKKGDDKSAFASQGRQTSQDAKGVSKETDAKALYPTLSRFLVLGPTCLTILMMPFFG